MRRGSPLARRVMCFASSSFVIIVVNLQCQMYFVVVPLLSNLCDEVLTVSLPYFLSFLIVLVGPNFYVSIMIDHSDLFAFCFNI